MDNDDHTAETTASDVITGQGQSQKTSQEDTVTADIKEEPLTKDYIKSEYLPELPSFIKAKMAIGKKLYSGCVSKQHDDVTVYLLDADLWKRFSNEGTEMVITKKGRRMFPVPSYAISHINPEKLYNVTLEITAVDHIMHKFSNGEWIVSKESSHLYPTPAPGRSTYLHPYSPNTGLHWMKEPITFSGLKISNNLDASGTIVLQSMRKYTMNLIISELNGSMKVKISQPETVFVAVTQYQNDRVTKMKIEHNPFANGFRFTSVRSRENPKRQLSKDADSENESKLDDVSSIELSPLSSLKALGLSKTADSETGSSDALKLVTYLEQKRHIFKHLLPTYFEQLNMGSLTDQSMNPKRGGWTTTLMPLCNTMYPLYDNASAFSGNSKSCLMFPVGEVNPLALVRQFGELNRCSDMDLPLSLVKKKKREHQVLAEECFIGNVGIHSKSLTDSRHLTSGNRCQRKKSQMTDDTPSYFQTELTDDRDVENVMEGQVHSTVGQDKYVPTLDSHVSCRTDDILVCKKSVDYHGVTCHIPADVNEAHHGERLENKIGCLPHTNTVSYLGPTDNRTNWHLNQETSKDFRSPENYNPVNLKTEPWLQLLSRPEVVLKNGDLWATTHEVVISSDGRPMFPFISLSVNKLCPDRYYQIFLKLVPNSPWIYNYSDHEWTPSMKATDKQKRTVHPHPENPKSGYHWGSDVNFDKLRLSTLKQGKNVLKVQLRRQYLPVVIVESENQLWEYPLKDAMFITVKIDRSQFQGSRLTAHYYPPSMSKPEKIFSDSLMESAHRQQTNNKIRNKDTTADDREGVWTFVNLPTQSSPLNLKIKDTLQPSPSTSHQLSPASWTYSSSSSSVPPASSPGSVLELGKLDKNLDIGKSETMQLSDYKNLDIGKSETMQLSDYKNLDIGKSETMQLSDYKNHDVGFPTPTSASSHFLPTVNIESDVDCMTSNVHNDSPVSSTLYIQNKSELAADIPQDCCLFH